MSPIVWWILMVVGLLIVFFPPVVAAGKGEKIAADQVGLEVTFPSMIGLALFTIAGIKLFPTEASDTEKQLLLIFGITCASIVSLSTMFSSCVRIRWQGF